MQTSSLATEFAAPGYRRTAPLGLLVPHPTDPRLPAWRREGSPALGRDGAPVRQNARSICFPDGRVVPVLAGGAQEMSYFVQNSAMATTAAPVKQPTGTAIRTMLQLSPQSSPSSYLHVIEWGCSFDATSAGTPGQVELVDTGTVPATALSTAFAAADIQKYGNANAPANTAGTGGVPLALGTSNSGFATAAVTEGSTTATRQADIQLIAPTNQYIKQMPLGREFEVPGGDFLRVRVTFGTTVNGYIYILFGT